MIEFRKASLQFFYSFPERMYEEPLPDVEIQEKRPTLGAYVTGNALALTMVIASAALATFALTSASPLAGAAVGVILYTSDFLACKVTAFVCDLLQIDLSKNKMAQVAKLIIELTASFAAIATLYPLLGFSPLSLTTYALLVPATYLIGPIVVLSALALYILSLMILSKIIDISPHESVKNTLCYLDPTFEQVFAHIDEKIKNNANSSFISQNS